MKKLIIFFVIFVFHVQAQVCGISAATQKYGWLFNNEDIFSTNRIIGGTTLQTGVFPWAVFLDLGCTGTIIGDRWILTAKHCVTTKYRVIKVYYGSSDHTSAMSQESSAFFSSPNPAKISGEDIALIQLPNPITFNENVSSICLSKTLRPKLHEQAVVAGYGLIFKSLKSNVPTGKELNDTNIETDWLSVLSAVPVHVIDDDNCKCHCTVPEDVDTDIREGVEMCAGGVNEGSMSGDSGGPQMYLDKNSLQWFQTGVTSRGSTISTGDVLKVSDRGIYTHVGHFCDWIEETTNKEVSCYD